MNTENEYLLLFRGQNWDSALSPEELQACLAQFMNWFEDLNQRGVLKAGQPLRPEGRVVSGAKGSTVTDGPYAEAKEAVGGYFLVRAETLDQAVQFAQECPALAYGMQVEVRQIAETCPMMEKLATQGAVAVGV